MLEKYADMTIDNNDVVHISYKEFIGGKGYIKYAWDCELSPVQAKK